jgi:hypothetical protein
MSLTLDQRRVLWHPNRAPVEIWWHDCGSPDIVSRARAEDWRKHGELEAGDIIRWEDGRKTVIKAQQEMLL